MHVGINMTSYVATAKWRRWTILNEIYVKNLTCESCDMHTYTTRSKLFGLCKDFCFVKFLCFALYMTCILCILKNEEIHKKLRKNL